MNYEYTFLGWAFGALIVLFLLYLNIRRESRQGELFSSNKSTPFMLVAIALLSLLVINQSLILTNDKEPSVIIDYEDDNRIDTHENQPIQFKVNGEARSFTSGKDFSPGRYIITSDEEAAVIFIRNAEGVKLVSEVIGTDSDSTSAFIVDLDEDWRVTISIGKAIELTPVYEVDFNLTSGYWTVGKDIQVKEDSYHVTFGDDNGLVTVFDENDKEVSKVGFDDNKSSTINLKDGYTIKIAGTNEVAFSPSK